MKLLVVSDSHGEVELLNKIYFENNTCDIFIHLGDSELPPYMMENYITVKGNCDFSDYPLFRDISTPYGIIHIVHGNYNYLSENEDPSKYFMYLFGHTHLKVAKKIGQTYVFNPGSLTRPRDSKNGSYLLINIIDKDHVEYEFKEIKLGD